VEERIAEDMKGFWSEMIEGNGMVDIGRKDG
jgi:hypothetical protein